MRACSDNAARGNKRTAGRKQRCANHHDNCPERPHQISSSTSCRSLDSCVSLFHFGYVETKTYMSCPMMHSDPQSQGQAGHLARQWPRESPALTPQVAARCDPMLSLPATIRRPSCVKTVYRKLPSTPLKSQRVSHPDQNQQAAGSICPITSLASSTIASSRFSSRCSLNSLIKTRTGKHHAQGSTPR